ncbi:MAG: hypothetical protein RMJ48_02745 [Roseiflexaceae bacterium]|nr:hypothetical protein [Roseiflexaceae bacterium]
MRDYRAWAEPLVSQLRTHWPEDAALRPYDCCTIELGLYVIQRLAPDMPAHALWTLLIGYPFPSISSAPADHQRALHIARMLLPFFRGPFPWKRALERYRRLPEMIRGYDVDDQCARFRQQSPAIASDRWKTYDQALSQAPRYRQHRLRPASAGQYRFQNDEFWEDMPIPESLVFPPSKAHPLDAPHQRAPISVTWDDLIETARWMDREAAARGLPPERWEQRLARVQLELISETDGTLQASSSLTINGLVHLIGMVGSGKSTLMDVLAVWMARNGRRATIVVGDVISVLDRADRFVRLGLPAAPILGASNRERHLQRLHRALAAARPLELLTHDHHGFTWLSTACALDGLRNQPDPLPPDRYPCQNLYPALTNKHEPLTCPLSSGCPFHRAQRDLVDALIWIATPASLIYSSVAPQINRERLRFAELAARRSDLVIFDEADRVQMHLDAIFSPSQTLVGGGRDAWLDRLWQHVVPVLNTEGRGQLRDESVDRWVQAHETAQIAANQMYTLLLREPALRAWVDRQDYFTDWLIFDRIARALSGAAERTRQESPEYQRLMSLFEDYLTDPLGERRDHRLAELARQAITHADRERLRADIRRWIDDHRSGAIAMTPEQSADLSVQIEFALLVAVLQDRIDMLFHSWNRVEAQLRLDASSSVLSHRSPDDYAGIVPAAPMGNVLAFQYVRPADDASKPGELRFFRCMGIGRWILLNFPHLFAGDGYAGPHTVLLSGSSWAGDSPGCHVHARVNGILRAPSRECDAIAQSEFHFLPIYDEEGRPIRVSGARLPQRQQALKALIHGLAKPGQLNGVSQLERVRDQLPEGRKKLLLLVGSYDEARDAADYLRQFRPEWERHVIHLVADDDEFESHWSTDSRLQRGLVAQFGTSEAWILVAPLLAVERGHNILNDRDEAAIGAAFFLVRPFPRPDDISYAIHAINRWAVEHYDNHQWYAQRLQTDHPSLAQMAEAFRSSAYAQWRRLLRTPLIYRTLDADDRRAITWTQLVTIWQVIGRLVRGGSPAKVFFCDAAFAPKTAAMSEEPDAPETSLLSSMRTVLRPYFSPDDQSVPESDRILVQALYGPFYTALEKMGGLADATL